MIVTTTQKPFFPGAVGSILRANPITCISAVCLFLGTLGLPSLLAQESTPPTTYKATIQGSAPKSRPSIDGYSGSVYIYTGGPLPALTYPAAFQFFFNTSATGSTTGYITPLLFEIQPVGQYAVYIVRGIGKGFEVSLKPSPQTIPFSIVQGDKFTPSGNFTFGFINALVGSTGIPTAVSEGAVEYDTPSVGGSGEGGPGTTNEWAASSSQDTDVALGTTFGVSGSNSADNLFSGYRTYSALVLGITVTQ